MSNDNNNQIEQIANQLASAESDLMEALESEYSIIPPFHSSGMNSTYQALRAACFHSTALIKLQQILDDAEPEPTTEQIDDVILGLVSEQCERIWLVNEGLKGLHPKRRIFSTVGGILEEFTNGIAQLNDLQETDLTSRFEVQIRLLHR